MKEPGRNLVRLETNSTTTLVSLMGAHARGVRKLVYVAFPVAVALACCGGQVIESSSDSGHGGSSGSGGSGGSPGADGSAGAGGSSTGGSGGSAGDSGGPTKDTGSQPDASPILCSATECMCPEGSTCTNSCMEGRCIAQCAAGSTCTNSCAGGSCVFECADRSICTNSCSGGSCDFQCADGSICTNSCSGGSCGCYSGPCPP
jgi:hypothetical protein